MMKRFYRSFGLDIEKWTKLGNSGTLVTQTHCRFPSRRSKVQNADCAAKLLAQAAPPNQNATVIGALSKRKIRWQNQNQIILNPSSVNFKKFTVAPLIIRRLITSTTQPRSSSYAGITGHLNSNLAFTFVAVQVAANVLPNAGNRPRAKDTISHADHQLPSWLDGWLILTWGRIDDGRHFVKIKFCHPDAT